MGGAGRGGGGAFLGCGGAGLSTGCPKVASLCEVTVCFSAREGGGRANPARSAGEGCAVSGWADAEAGAAGAGVSALAP